MLKKNKIKTNSRTKTSNPIPYLKKTGSTTQLIVDGKPMVLLGGEVHNSSSSNLNYMEKVWETLTALHCNCAIVPLYWELIEPQEGTFDFDLLDGLLKGARSRNLRLILLWFGTWKNTDSTYTPAWVKKDPSRFFLARDEKGTALPKISCLCDAAAKADARAFAAVMKHIKAVDSKERTVVMVQVENETGILGPSRDFSSAATIQFNEPVPDELMASLVSNKENLIGEFHTLWERNGFKQRGNWQEIFGADADEIFMAWHIGRFVDTVAAAGKKEYNLPMFANCWLVQFEGEKPGAYPSGGPVSRMMDVWRAAALHIDLLAPDIYIDSFKETCASYVRSGNPLLIPEANRDERAAMNGWYALGNHDAICFAPFGIDSIAQTGAVEQSNKVLRSLLHLLPAYHGTGHLKGFVQQTGETHADIILGTYRLHITFLKERTIGLVGGCGLIIMRNPGEFILAGGGFKGVFTYNDDDRQVGLLSVDEGEFMDQQWVPGRRLNGDELAIVVDGFGVRLIKVYDYQ